MPVLFRIFLVLMCVIPSSFLYSKDFLLPLVYPEDEITNPKPYIIWQDKYRKRPGSPSSRFRVTLTKERKRQSQTKGKLVYSTIPEPIFDQFYTFRLPVKLETGRYSLEIEKLHRGKSVTDRRYYYKKYPAERDFFINTDDMEEADFLHPRFYIARHALETERSFYGYDALYSFIGSTGSAAIGYAVYRYFGSTIYGKIIAGICFASAGIGYGASVYFTGSYISLGMDMSEIEEIGTSRERASQYDEKRLKAEFNLKF